MESRKDRGILIGMSESWPDEITARIARAIKDLRGDRSGQWLSDRTERLGHRVSRSTISEIETGRRKSITIADLIILARALDTVPLALIYPGPYDEKISVLPDFEVPQIWGARWFAGELRTVSEVPFDDGGHYVRIANPKTYSENTRYLENARKAAQLYDQKTAMWRELNRLRRMKDEGVREVGDDEVRDATDAIARYQTEIDFLMRAGDESSDGGDFTTLVDETWSDGR